jgi:hypothetical protein
MRHLLLRLIPHAIIVDVWDIQLMYATLLSIQTIIWIRILHGRNLLLERHLRPKVLMIRGATVTPSAGILPAAANSSSSSSSSSSYKGEEM